MRREDLIFIIRQRGVHKGVWNYDIERLEQLALPLTDAERESLLRQRQLRSACDATYDELKLALAGSAPKLETPLREVLLDLLIEQNHPIIPEPMPFDDCQQDAIARSRTAKRLFIMASAGAGKTMTLCEIIAQAAIEPEARIIVLIFNVYAETTLKERLKKKGVDLIDTDLNNPKQYGCAVLTFHKLGERINRSVEDPYDCEDPLGYNTSAREARPRGSYREGLEHAAYNILNYGFGTWTHVIVDEGQDVVPEQSVFVDALYAAHADTKLIVAGDAKQQLYEGAVWFSKLWFNASDDEKVILRYNHRSHPQIVDAINAFGRKHFPLLHHDQIASRAAGTGGVTIRHIKNGDDGKVRMLTLVGRECAKRLSERDPCDVYAVAAITTDKYGFEFARDAMRQHITEHSKHRVIPLSTVNKAEGDKSEGDTSYKLGTAKKLKGTERSRVLALGCDREYDLCCDRASQIRSMFVTLSRARDELIIYVRNHKSQSQHLELLKPVLDVIPNDVIFRKYTEAKLEPRREIKVSDDGQSIDNGLSAIDGVTLQTHDMPTAPTIDIPISEYDSDFVGCYVEALIANTLGIKLATFNSIQVYGIENKGVDAHTKFGFFRNKNGTYRIVCSKYRETEIKDTIQRLKQQYNNSTAAYIHAVIHYSSRAAAFWTVSERFADKQFECDVANYIKRVVDYDSGIISYQEQFMFRLSPTECLIGIPDFIINGIPIEIKHVGQLTDSHRRQAAIYATMCNSTYAILLNTFDGKTERIMGVPRPELSYLGIAALKLENAKKFARSEVTPPFRPASVIISVGVNTAVAFNSADYSVIAVIPNYSCKSDLYDWIASKTGRRTYLHCDASLIEDLPDGDNIAWGSDLSVNESDLSEDKFEPFTDAVTIAAAFIEVTRPVDIL